MLEKERLDEMLDAIGRLAFELAVWRSMESDLGSILSSCMDTNGMLRSYGTRYLGTTWFPSGSIRRRIPGKSVDCQSAYLVDVSRVEAFYAMCENLQAPELLDRHI